MPRQSGLTVIIVLGLFLTQGCAFVGKNFSTDGLAGLRLGETTEGEVRDLFGKPFKEQNRSDQGFQAKLLVYSYAIGTVGSGKSRRLAAEFVDKLLNAYLFHSALGDDSTDFDIGDRDKVAAGMSRNDAVALLGSPDGEVRYPSVLLKNEFGSLPEIVPPDGATRALVYNYIEVKRKRGLLNSHLKLLILFVSPQNTIIEVRHFEGVL